MISSVYEFWEQIGKLSNIAFNFAFMASSGKINQHIQVL